MIFIVVVRMNSKNAFVKPDEQCQACLNFTLVLKVSDLIHHFQISGAKVNLKCAFLLRSTFFFIFFLSVLIRFIVGKSQLAEHLMHHPGDTNVIPNEELLSRYGLDGIIVCVVMRGRGDVLPPDHFLSVCYHDASGAFVGRRAVDVVDLCRTFALHGADVSDYI